MKNKKIITSIVFLILISITVGMIIKTNKPFPQKDTIKEYSINEPVENDNFIIKVTEIRDGGVGDEGFPKLEVDFTIENTTDENLDLSDIDTKFNLYQDFDEAIAQNIDIGLGDTISKNPYYRSDFKLKAREKKKYTFIYNLYKENKNYKNFIYIDNSYYAKEYKKYLDNKVIMYKIINLGDVYE